MFYLKLNEERKEFREGYIFEQKKKVLLGMMDILILSWIKTVPLCGQDIMDKIKKEYGVSIGSGTMYPILFNLYGKDIVNTTRVNKKKLYHLTEKGKEIVDVWLETPFSGAERHIRRLKKVEKIESEEFKQ